MKKFTQPDGIMKIDRERDDANVGWIVIST